MANLDRIASVSITLNTTAIAQQSFSDILVVGEFVGSLARILKITSADDLLDFGVKSTDPLYLAAMSVFSQTPHVDHMYIGRKQADTAILTVTSASESVYTVRIGERAEDGSAKFTDVSYTAAPADTVAVIAEQLASLIEASDALVEAVVSEGVVTISPAVAGDAFSVVAKGNINAASGSSSETYADTLSAIKEENNDWYMVAITSRSKGDVLAVAAWVESNDKLFGTSSSSPDLLDAAVTNDIASTLQLGNYYRTNVWYHAKADTEWIECAVASNRFTYYPGQETWANVKLGGVTVDLISETQASAAHAKNCNTFERFRNFSITQQGKVAAGEWIDVIRFRDWLKEQITINVVSAFINADGKIPYTDPGIQIIGMKVQEALDLGVRRGGIAPKELDENNDIVQSYVITLPRNSSIPFNDKANRVLNDVKFTARLAGAIHVVKIKGSLTYEL